MNNNIKLLSACLLLALSASSQALETAPRTVPASNDGGNLINLDYEYGPNKPGRMQSFKTRYSFIQLNPTPVSTRFVATQFWIDPKGQGGGDPMYIGVNPPNNQIGYPGQAHFSYFGSRGGQILSGQCHSDADGGNGITCTLNNLRAKQGYTYELEAKVAGYTSNGTILEGYVTEFNNSNGSVTGTYQIGKFEVKIPNGEISYPFGWVEGGGDLCANVTQTEIMYSEIFLNSNYSSATSAPVKQVTSAKCGAQVWPNLTHPLLYLHVKYGQ
jgi:hypothetical protein